MTKALNRVAKQAATRPAGKATKEAAKKPAAKPAKKAAKVASNAIAKPLVKESAKKVGGASSAKTTPKSKLQSRSQSQSRSHATEQRRATAKPSAKKNSALTKSAPARITPTTSEPRTAASTNATAATPDAKPAHRVFRMPFASVYPHYIAKVEKKGRTKAELDRVIEWLTGYDAKGLARVLADKVDFERFYTNAPRPNPARDRVTGVVCGIRVETIEDPLMRELRILDKLVDELAKGWPMERVLREG